MKERHMLRSAVHLILRRNDEIMLLRRYNTGYQDGNYSLVAGHLDGGENYMEAMMREAREEVGIHIERENLKTVQVMHRTKGFVEYIDYFLECTSWSGELSNMEPDKCDELKWVRIQDLPHNTVPYIAKALDYYQSKMTFTMYGWDDGEVD